jgi:hypothetical protein
MVNSLSASMVTLERQSAALYANLTRLRTTAEREMQDCDVRAGNDAEQHKFCDQVSLKVLKEESARHN